MAHDTQRDKRKFIEFNNLFVDYTEGDVVILDNVMDLVHLHPPKQNSSMIVFFRGGNAKIQASNSNVEMGKGDARPCFIMIMIVTVSDCSCCSLFVLTLSLRAAPGGA